MSTYTDDETAQLRWALEAVLPQIEKIQRGANQSDLARKIEAARFMLNRGDDADGWVCIKRILYFVDAPDWRTIDKVVTEEEGEAFEIDDLHSDLFKRAKI